MATEQAPPRAATFGMFFGSGVASLMCEVAWFKQLGLVLGHNAVTASIVIACFFGGLATGSLLVGRASDRWARPLRRYGALELSLAVTSLLTSVILWKWTAWIGWFNPWMSLDSGTALPVKTLLALIIMLPGTVLMGATLPVLTRHLVRSKSELASSVGTLYGLNTLGAVVGSSLMGFWLIGAVGVVESASIASLIYASIGGIALLLARTEPALDAAQLDAGTPEVDADAKRAGIALVLVFGASGFLAIGYEVLWFRLLGYSAANTVYTFSAMLATYLLGLVLGALVCARWISRDKSALLASFARVQLGIGVAAAISLGFAGQVATLLHALDYSALDASGLAKLGLVVALVVLAPTTLIGMSFPLASELAVHRLSALGSRVGLLYSLNTYGGVLGSLCAGLVLLPLIGVQAAFVLFVLGNFALFGALWLTQPELRGFPGLKREAALSAGMVAVVLVLLGPGYIRRQLTLYPGEKLVYEETEDATFMVLQHDDPLVGPFQQLVVNGTSYANNRPEGRRYMALLAHLPMLLHPEPTETVVICVGTGTTIGAASLHDRARQVWSVDVTRHVFGYAKHFVPLNNHFFEKPHVHQVASDGRHFLQVTDRRFDVLTFEPPPPIESGVVNLYSREFYELADARLAEGGIVAQWIPFQQGFEEIHRMLVRTMDDVFPHTSLWIPNRDEGILIGSHQPLRIDYAALAERMREPDVARDLHEVGIDSPEDLLATFVGADDDLRAYVGDVPVVTDDHPFVEHFFRYPNDRFDVRDALAHGTPIEAVLTGPLPDPDAMAHARRAQEKLWDAERNIRGQQWQAADADLTAALAERPGNTYLTFIQGVTRRVMERRQSGAGDPR